MPAMHCSIAHILPLKKNILPPYRLYICMPTLQIMPAFARDNINGDVEKHAHHLLFFHLPMPQKRYAHVYKDARHLIPFRHIKLDARHHFLYPDNMPDLGGMMYYGIAEGMWIGL